MKRAFGLLFGLVSYATFLGVFLYAVGFVGGFLVPTRLDAPGTSNLLYAVAMNTSLLALFAVQHSVMARPGFKRVWTRVVPKPMERSVYVLLSSVALAVLFWQWRPMGGVVWEIQQPWLRAITWSLFAAGWLIVLSTTFMINHFDLFGLRQVWLYFRHRPYTSLPFVTPGAYRLVRHPLYVGWLLAFWATPTMTVAHLLFALGTTAYILVAIRFEERDLVRHYGSRYERYQHQVPLLVPRLRGGRGEPGRAEEELADVSTVVTRS